MLGVHMDYEGKKVRRGGYEGGRMEHYLILGSSRTLDEVGG